ncbi:hypothetical protein CCACVL1_11883, partial [Corchorus capsularis]
PVTGVTQILHFVPFCYLLFEAASCHLRGQWKGGRGMEGRDTQN